MLIISTTFKGVDREAQQAFADWLLSVGNGDMEDLIIPQQMMSNCTKVDDFIDAVFDFSAENSIQNVYETSIMSPKNSSADLINNIAITKFPGILNLLKLMKLYLIKVKLIKAKKLNF